MDDLYEVHWTERSLSNALEIKAYLKRKFNKKEIVSFEELLKQFENTVLDKPGKLTHLRRMKLTMANGLPRFDLSLG